VGSSREDTANVGGSSSDLDVSVNTPRGTPGVLDEEVVLSGLGSETNGEDTVIERLSASLGDDTTGVSLEGELVGLNGNGDWSDGEGGLKLVWGSWGHIDESGNLTLGLRSIISAGALVSGVWVSGLELDSLGLNVLEGVVHKTTIAAHVSVAAGAVNELLLRVGLQVSGGDELGTLDGSGGGESPA